MAGAALNTVVGSAANKHKGDEGAGNMSCPVIRFFFFRLTIARQIRMILDRFSIFIDG